MFHIDQKNTAERLDELISTATTQGGEFVLACPACKDENIHPIEVHVVSAGSANQYVRIDSNGVFLNPNSGRAGRGAMIVLKFACEQGHEFEYQMLFHKGSTFVERVISDSSGNWRTIWRD